VHYSENKMKIVDHILSHKSNNYEISGKPYLAEFFQNFHGLDDDWPIACIDDRYKEDYLSAKAHSDYLRLTEELHTAVNFHSEKNSFLVEENFSYSEDMLDIELDSVMARGKKDDKSSQFVYKFLQRHRKFMDKLVSTGKIDPRDVTLNIHAHSGVASGVMTRGGYVWATYGFDFKSKNELMTARKAFQNFAQKNNIAISDSDMKHFKYPCHFAAFCVGDAENRKEIGKEFLLQYDWFGKISADQGKDSELYRYQKAYHEQGKKAAEKELSKAYLCVLNKYAQYNDNNSNFWERILDKKRLFDFRPRF